MSYLASIERRFSDGLPRLCAYCGSGAPCFLEMSTCVACMRDGKSVTKGKGKARVTGRELRSMEETCPDWSPVPMRSRKAALLDVMGYFDDSVTKGKGKARVTGRELRSMEETCPDWSPVPMRSRKAALLDVMGYFDDESVPDALRPLGGAVQRGAGKGGGK